MRRIYNLPFGVVPQVPPTLVPFVTLGDVEKDGLVRSFSVDRYPSGDVPLGSVGVTWLEVAALFLDEQVIVKVYITGEDRRGPQFKAAGRVGQWSVQQARVLGDPCA